MRLSRYKKIIAAIASAAAVCAVSASALAAPVYRDVPSTHWAYQYISAVADKGLMTGDISANFRPDELLDKFETSRILARSAGYKYENVSAAEQEYYNGCYEKNKSFLAQYSAKFSKWNTAADREIAYLIEKEILTASDLNQFVILSDSGGEQLRALSRGEAAQFITKLMGRSSQALSHSATTLFNDDARISATVKPYVYYLNSISVISGDGGSFNPNGGVTRAAMASMLARAMALATGGDSPAAAAVPSATPAAGTGTGGAATITTVSGTIDVYYANLNAVQILTGSGEKRIYRLSAKGSVHVDGYLKTGADLKEGMTVSGVLENDELIDLRAQSGATRPSAVTPPASSPEAQYFELEGTVASIDQNGAVSTVNIEVKTVNPRDNSIVSETRSYALAANCKITRGGGDIKFSEISRGDIITAQVSGGSAYELELEEKLLTLRDARLDEKIYDARTGDAAYLVSDLNGKQYELKIASDTTVSRKSVGVTTWDQLRVGDVLELTAEYGVLLDVMAYGVLSSADGWIDAINIGEFQSYIMLRGAEGKTQKYYVIPESTDVYSLRVGDKMRVRLDSGEISTVMLLEEGSSGIVTGYVDIIRSNEIVLVNTQPYGINGRHTVEIDAATVFTNTRTGDHVNYNAIRTGQRLYVVYYNTGSNLAKTVTILSD